MLETAYAGSPAEATRGPVFERASDQSRRALAVATVVVLSAALGAGCASSSGVTPRPRPFPSAPAPSPPSHPPVPVDDAAGASSARAESAIAGYALVDVALQFLGTPYRNGGSDPSGFDCSGFVQYVFHRFGRDVGRTVLDQFAEGRSVQSAEIQPGDLIF